MMRFDPTQMRFSWPNARAAAAMSDLAYLDESSASRYRWAIFVDDPFTSAQAIVEDCADCIVIAFKGSKEPKDFICDAEFWMTELLTLADGSEAKVHAGFLQDFNAINGGIIREVKKLAPNGFFIAGIYTFGCPRVGNSIFAHLYNNAPARSRAGQRPVFICGHSLGGALATLCALEFARISEGVSAVNLGDITFNLTNACDPVPLLPPLLCGYRDCGQEIFLPASGQPQRNPFIGFEIVSDMLGALASWRNHQLAFLPKHFLKAYQQRIQILA